VETVHPFPALLTTSGRTVDLGAPGLVKAAQPVVRCNSSRKTVRPRPTSSARSAAACLVQLDITERGVETELLDRVFRSKIVPTVSSWQWRAQQWPTEYARPALRATAPATSSRNAAQVPTQCVHFVVLSHVRPDPSGWDAAIRIRAPARHVHRSLVPLRSLKSPAPWVSTRLVRSAVASHVAKRSFALTAGLVRRVVVLHVPNVHRRSSHRQTACRSQIEFVPIARRRLARQGLS